MINKNSGILGTKMNYNFEIDKMTVGGFDNFINF